MKLNTVLSFISIIMLGVLLFLVGRTSSSPQLQVQPQAWQNEDQLHYANKLFAKGLKKEAVGVLERYVNKTFGPKKEMAKIYYRLGNAYMDLYEYEKALSAFYRAEMLYSEADFAQDMNQKIVQALENLGMTSQAQYELSSRVSLAEPAVKQGKSIARIGKRQITESEIDEALQALPEWMRKNFASDQKRLEFIRQYVATEVLYEKAKRLGLDRTSQFRSRIEEFKKQAAVQEILQQEIESKLKVNDSDLELYYKANKAKYAEPAKLKLSYLKMEDSSKQEDIRKKLRAGEGKSIEGWIREGDVYLPGIGEAKSVIEGLFLKEKGSLTDPLKISDAFYIFSIDEKVAERQKPFAEVKSQVEYEYKLMKQQEITDALLQKALEEQEVEIFYVPQKLEENELKDTQ
jgi:peptidyl-prolyl cis-trans isomerase C